MNERKREILQAATEALDRSTGFRALLTEKPAVSGIDVIVTIKTPQGNRRFTAEVKAVDRFQTPGQVKAQLAHRAELPLLVAPFISRETAEHCRQLHLSFLDTAGNAFLEAPSLYVYVTGQPRPKSSEESRFRAVGAAGLRVTFALLSRPALACAPYREIANAAGAALGTITHVMRDLETRGLLIGENRRRLLDPKRLLDEWVTHYPITLRPKLHPRRFEAPLELLAEADLKPLEAYWSGERAAERLTGLLKPAAFTLYARKPINRLVAALRLHAQRTGKVELLDAFWNFDADPEYPDVVPPVLAYADLLNSRDGRNLEAAKQIYEQRIEPEFQACKAAQ